MKLRTKSESWQNLRRIIFEDNADEMGLQISGSIYPDEVVTLIAGRPEDIGDRDDDNWGIVETQSGERRWVWLGLMEEAKDKVLFGTQSSNPHNWIWLHPPTRQAVDRVMDAAQFDAFMVYSYHSDDPNQAVTTLTLDMLNSKGIPDRNIIGRIFAKPHDFYAPTLKQSAEKFVNLAIPGIAQLEGRVEYWQIHNEANLIGEGMFFIWHTPAEFVTWYLFVLEGLKKHFPKLKWIYPGCSPSMSGSSDHGIRFNSDAFLEDTCEAVEASDALAHHVYGDWLHARPDREAEIQLMVDETWNVATHFPDMPLFMTEVAVSHANISKRQMGIELRQYYHAVKDIPNLKGVYQFCLVTSSGDVAQHPHALIWGDEKQTVRDHSVEAAEEIGKR